MQIRPLEKKDYKSLAELLNGKLKTVYPFKEADKAAIELFLQDNKTIENAEIAGLFEKETLKGAACFGILPKTGKRADFNLIEPGDGVILWLVCSKTEAGYEILSYALSKLPEKVFAYPEFGSLRVLTLFNTGMLPSTFIKEEIVFRTSAFCIPATEEWGPQERCWFKKEIPANLEPFSAPGGFEIKREIMEGYKSRLKLFDKDILIGECNTSNLKLYGKPYPKHFYIDWLSVNNEHRNHSLGSKLLLEQCLFARKKGATTNLLTTHTGRPAYKLYRKLGYIGMGLSRTFYIKQR